MPFGFKVFQSLSKPVSGALLRLPPSFGPSYNSMSPGGLLNLKAAAWRNPRLLFGRLGADLQRLSHSPHVQPYEGPMPRLRSAGTFVRHRLKGEPYETQSPPPVNKEASTENLTKVTNLNPSAQNSLDFSLTCMHARFDQRPPDQIFQEGGLFPPGEDTSLWRHVGSNDPKSHGYISFFSPHGPHLPNFYWKRESLPRTCYYGNPLCVIKPAELFDAAGVKVIVRYGRAAYDRYLNFIRAPHALPVPQDESFFDFNVVQHLLNENETSSPIPVPAHDIMGWNRPLSRWTLQTPTKNTKLLSQYIHRNYNIRTIKDMNEFYNSPYSVGIELLKLNRPHFRPFTPQEAQLLHGLLQRRFGQATQSMNVYVNFTNIFVQPNGAPFDNAFQHLVMAYEKALTRSGAIPQSPAIILPPPFKSVTFEQAK